MEDEKPNYYGIMPADVRYDKNLTPSAKILYTEFSALCNKNGYCWPTNKYFCELYGVSQVSVSKWINILKKYGYIEIFYIYEDGSKEIAERRISLVALPLKEKFNTPLKEKFNTPLKEKFKDNSIKNNIINNNNTSITENKNPETFGFLDAEELNKEIKKSKSKKIPDEISIVVETHYKKQLELRPNQVSRQSRLETKSIEDSGVSLLKISKKFNYDIGTIKQMLEFSLTNDFWQDKTTSLLYSNLTKQWTNGIKIDCLYDDWVKNKRCKKGNKIHKQYDPKNSYEETDAYGKENTVAEM